MKRSDHCEQSVRLFGQDFNHVHAWLDELFGIYRARHRAHRHHWEGIRKVREMWGEQAMRAAIQHIVDDLQQLEDPMANESWIAKDYHDYKERGYI